MPRRFQNQSCSQEQKRDLKAKVNSKIAPVERFGISTPARSRGSNRNSRLQKKVRIDQEVEPALRFAMTMVTMRVVRVTARTMVTVVRAAARLEVGWAKPRHREAEWVVTVGCTDGEVAD